MYNKQKRKEKYQRHKNGVLKKCCNEQVEAYRLIKDKFVLNDYEIKDLLYSYTVTEILQGEFEEGIFKPKNLIRIFILILCVIGVFCFGYNITQGKKQLGFESFEDTEYILIKH